MSHNLNESGQMPRSSPVRIRTFLVPLFGAALYYAVILISSFIAMLFLGERYERHMYLIHAISMLALIPLVIIWVYVSERVEGKKLFRRHLSPPIVLSGIIIAFGLLGITMLYFYFADTVLSPFSFVQESLEEYEALLSVGNLTLFEKIAYSISVTLLVPIVEELIFRGIILQEFLSTMKPVVAVILTSAVFAIVHVQPIQVGYAFLCGVVISAVYVLSHSIFLTILLHSVYNFFGSVLQIVYPASEEWFDIMGIMYFAAIALSVVAVLYLKRDIYGKTKTEDHHASSFGE
ncbi:MAG: CPBP family intramembrane metalloprotease [Clostridiales bacterium]|nr:CPBP family intramembrane metalloprotease [Clostridiales bacterium]